MTTTTDDARRALDIAREQRRRYPDRAEAVLPAMLDALDALIPPRREPTRSDRYAAVLVPVGILQRAAARCDGMANLESGAALTADAAESNALARALYAAARGESVDWTSL